MKLAQNLGVSIDYLLSDNINEYESSKKKTSKHDKNQEFSLTSEDLELLNQIRQASADKQKAIELILGIKEQAALVSSDK